MPLEVEAIPEGVVLRLDDPSSLEERERVMLTVKPHEGPIRRSAGLVPWTGEAKAREYLLGPDNLPQEESW